MDVATRIVKKIELDLTDRYGLRQEWAQIDAKTKSGIRKKWKEIIRKELKNANS